MFRIKAIGVCCYPYYSYVDHIVPLCQILNIPLLCPDHHLESFIKTHYPSMQIIYEPDIQHGWKAILDDFNALVYTDFYRRHHGVFQFLDFVYSRNMPSIYCPHGNSDKGQNTFWMERFAEEDTTLLYGEKMADFLKAKGVWPRLKNPRFVGNFRHQFYQIHQHFFDEIIRSEVGPKKDKINLLYVPTWQTRNLLEHLQWDRSSFFSAYRFLFDNIPDKFHLFVKVHPNLNEIYNKEMNEIKEKYRGVSNLSFIDDCHLIYPLLTHMDAYIGDLSSVGYDFIVFDKPMFFLTDAKRVFEEKKDFSLYQCGVQINYLDFKNIYGIIQNDLEAPNESLSAIRKKMTSYTYTQLDSLELLLRGQDEN